MPAESGLTITAVGDVFLERPDPGTAFQHVRKIFAHADGCALNADPGLAAFPTFTACRLAGVTMVSLREIALEQGKAVRSDAEVHDAVAAALC